MTPPGTPGSFPAPGVNAARSRSDQRPLLRIENLAVSFATERGQIPAVNGVSLCVYPGQTLAVVGESGCGKSVSALSTMQLIPRPPGSIDRGQIWWQPDAQTPARDLLTFDERQMRDIRGNDIAMIFQEPMTSLNPVYTVGDQILEAIRLHQRVTRAQARAIALEALTDVGIADPASRLRDYPHQLSGGMRQRIMIAMALACQPKLLLADEPTTALDVTIQAQILDLLRHLQISRQMAIMLITHDLGVVAENADAVAVMYAGRVVEYGSVVDIFERPLHPYTVGLFQSMPVLGNEAHRLVLLEGQVPNLAVDAREPAWDLEGRRTEQVVPALPELADVIMHDGRAMRIFRRSAAEQPSLRQVQPGHWVAAYTAPGYAHAPETTPDVTYRRASAHDLSSA